jgi:hypothetical protein
VLTVCKSPNASATPNKPVDLWTTLRVAHRAHRRNSNSNDEQNANCVTYVAG